jgi:hypothetical protein
VADVTLGQGLGWALAVVLATSAGLKLAAPRESRAALATFGLTAARARAVAWGVLVAVEIALALGVAAESHAFAYAGAALMLVYAAALAAAVGAGRTGAPCGCFGARSRVGRGAVARNLALAAGLAAVPALDSVKPSTDGWLAAGLAIALVAVAALGVAVLALAREVGALRLSLPAQSALELTEEGPPLGSATRLIEAFGPLDNATLALAVFTSDGCHVCHSLAPAIEFLKGDPFVALRVFDEDREASAWADLDVPGSPFAVALDRSGTVLAKGSFNSLPQLESVLGTAERRARGQAEHSEAVGA